MKYHEQIDDDIKSQELTSIVKREDTKDDIYATSDNLTERYHSNWFMIVDILSLAIPSIMCLVVFFM